MRKFVVGLLFVLLAAGMLPAMAQQGGTGAQPAASATPESTPVIVVSPEIYDRATNSYQAGDFKKAIFDYSLFILLNPTFSQAYYLRARSYTQLQQYDKALADLSQALKYPSSGPQFTAQVYSRLAELHLAQDDLSAAMSDLNNGIAAAPDVPDTYYTRAQLYAAQNHPQDALSDYNKVIALDPKFAEAYLNRGFINQAGGKLADALADYNKVIELAPNDPSGYAQRAMIYINQGKFQDALTDLDNAIRLSAQNADTSQLYLSRASAHAELKHAADATADYVEWIRRVHDQDKDGPPLRPGESVTVTMSRGVVYYFAFTGKAGQKVTLSAAGRPDAKVDTLLVLLDPDGKPLAADDDSGGDFSSLIQDFALPKDGQYILALGHAGGNPNGPVRVLMQVSS
jgi:tetratricopeptide (TPR) repeat protein